MTSNVAQIAGEDLAVATEEDLFGIFVSFVSPGPTTGQVIDTTGQEAPYYLSRRAGMCFNGTWDEVANRLVAAGSTSSYGSLVGNISSSPHPTPATATRVRQLKERSGLTWEQLRKAFGVSRRSLHLWAGGARMNSLNEERLASIEGLVERQGATTPAECRSALLSPTAEGGRSLFQQLLLERSTDGGEDIEARTESSGESYPIHGEFLHAEAIDVDDAGM